MRFLGLEIIAKEQRSDPGFDDRYWTNPFETSSTGTIVSAETAERYSAVYSCVKVISETIASLPLILYKRVNRGKERATDHPLFRVLNIAPNSWMTRMEWVENCVRHILLRGNAYNYIQSTNSSGKVVSIIPLHPDYVSVENIAKRSDEPVILQYKYNNRIYSDKDIIHFRGPSNDGINGRGPIQQVRETLGINMALEEHAAATLGNMARLSGVLEHPGHLDDAAAQRIQNSWMKAYSGSKNSGKTAVLEEGMKFNAVSMSNVDAQFVEYKKMSWAEIAGIFRVPPHMIGNLEKSTYSNIEHQGIDFVVHTIRPWVVRIEQALMRDILTQFGMEKDYLIEFLLDGLLRGDTASRYQAYSVGFNNGFLSPNDIREMENKNPIDDGDVYLVPLNMTPIDKIGESNEEPTKEETPIEEDKPDRGLLFSDAIRQLNKTFRNILVLTFERAITRERIAISGKAGTTPRKKFDEWLTDFYSKHKAYFREQIEPVINSYSEQLILISQIYKEPIGLLPNEFIDQCVGNYIGERFETVYTMDGALLMKDKGPTLEDLAEKAKVILQQVGQLMKGEKGNGIDTGKTLLLN